MKKIFFTVYSSFIIVGTFSCAKAPDNPYENPNNTKINVETSLLNIKDSLKIGNAYACSVDVYLPKNLDSLIVRLSHGGFDSVLFKDAAGPASPVIFSFSPMDTGNYAMQIIIVKTNGSRDSLPGRKQFKIFGPSVPVVTPVTSSYQAYLGDSIIVKFHVVTHDSNLLGYSTSLGLDPDSSKSHRVDVYYSLVSRIGDDTIARTLTGKILLEGLQQPLVCYAQAVDRAYAYSAMASCSISVIDTTKPQLQLLPPHTAVTDSILNLPDSIIVRAADSWGIDSVTVNGAKMILSADTTAKFIISSLAQGENHDTIIAWDKARNTDTIFMTFKYGGPPAYPPKIKLLDRSIREGRVFDTLFLDTCVDVTDPAITTDSATYKASLSWIITDSIGNLVSTYNVTTRKLFIPVIASDSEWVDTFTLNFKVVAPNGLYDMRTGTFKVNEVPDPPAVTLRAAYWKLVGTPFDTLYLDTCAKDPDNPPSALQWNFKNGKTFKIDSIFSSSLVLPKTQAIIPIDHIRLRFFTRRIAVIPANPADTAAGSDTLLFTVKDPGGLSNKKNIIFTKSKFKPLFIDSLSFRPAPGKRNK